MKIEKFGVYLADLGGRAGTEAGKVRPVVVIQTDLLNHVHPSTVICPMTTHITKEASVLRVRVSKTDGELQKDSDIMVDQMRAIDNSRFLKRVGKLKSDQQEKILENLRILVLE